MKDKLKKFIFFAGIFLAFLLILFFIFRNNILNWGIQKASDKIKDRSQAVLNIKNAYFSGLATINLFDLSLTPASGDTIVQADSLSVRFSVWTMLLATLRIKEIHASGVKIALVCNDSLCNYSGFTHSQKVQGKPLQKNYAALFRNLIEKLFNLAPQRASLFRISLTYIKDDNETRISIPEFHSDEKNLSGFIEDTKNGNSWKCQGFFSQTKHKLELSVFPVDGIHQLPLVRELTGVSIGFDTLHLAMNNYRSSGGKFTVDGNFYVKKLIAYHKKISDDSVKVPSSNFDFRFHAGRDFLEIDSTSAISLGSIHFIPYLKYSSGTSKEYSVKISTIPVLADDFFSSLPSGIFDEVRDFRAYGYLRFLLNFNLNESHPDDVIFNVSLKKQKFRLRNSGSVDLFKLNSEFTQNVFENGRLIRSFSVGPSNPYYTPLAEISPYLINSILTSEDGNFYFHNGFNEDAFRHSIAANFKAGKFVRGGSTISMQLVKNVFLTRKKTIARKAEEALIVWLIENNRLVTKERMLEVYLNIIELGPDVYGVGEAASFYFKKKPSQITLPEGIFLASLLPRPKWFKSNFDTLGNIKPVLADYYRIVSDFMLRKNLITQAEHDSLVPNVVLTGAALEIVMPEDTIPEEVIELE